jgi:hypothetical protein
LAAAHLPDAIALLRGDGSAKAPPAEAPQHLVSPLKTAPKRRGFLATKCQITLPAEWFVEEIDACTETRARIF